MKRAITQYAILGLLLLFVAAICIDLAQAKDALYMVIRPTAQGFEFDCTKEYPLRFIAEQEQWRSYAREPQNLILVEQVIEVERCNLQNVYSAYEGAHPVFVWSFDYRLRDGHLEHRHFASEPFWAQMLDVPFLSLDN
jgi:hypothetical protein